MRVLKRNRWLSGLALLLAVLVVYGSRALADATTNDPGSIVIFPKVIANGTRDTLIQITNTSNMPAQAHCIYVNGTGQCSLTGGQCVRANVTNLGSPDCPPLPPPNTNNRVHEDCLSTCTERNFDIFLTAQQPTVWRASTGRFVDSTDALRGFDPGRVLPTLPDMQGELKCIQTEPVAGEEVPSDMNSLKGEAVLETIANGEISEYNAIAIKAFTDGSLNGDNFLQIGTEYNACPGGTDALWINHYADGATDVLFPDAKVTTELTLVPCSEDLEDGVPTPSRAEFQCVNDQEGSCGSAGISFDCYFDALMGDIIPVQVGGTGSDFLKTAISTGGKVCFSGDNFGKSCSDNNGCLNANLPNLGCRNRPGLLGVVEEFHTTSGQTVAQGGSAAANLHIGRTRAGDLIIPPSILTP
jgi:hypothetical protein